MTPDPSWSTYEASTWANGVAEADLLRLVAFVLVTGLCFLIFLTALRSVSSLRG